MLVSEIIFGARELDGSFTPVRHPDGTLRRALARIQRHLIGQIIRVDPRAVTSTLEITLPLATFSDGAPLEAGSPAAAIDITRIHVPLDIYFTGDTEPTRLDLIDWTDRHRVVSQRYAYIRSGTLYLTGTESLWSDATKIVLTYTPTPQTLGEGDTLVLPLTAEDALITALGAFMARRSKPVELEKPKRDFLQDAADAETMWLDETRRRKGVTVSVTREEW